MDGKIDDVKKLRLIISKCQNDIKKLLILLEYYKKCDNIDNENIILKKNIIIYFMILIDLKSI